MVGGCQKKEPGAGMDSSLGLVKVYKDGYFHLRCTMDKMEQAADYHDELQREHKYNVHTNVSIVRYTDRVDVEKQQSMTPSICFEFCRTVPDMLHFGLTAGREAEVQHVRHSAAELKADARSHALLLLNVHAVSVLNDRDIRVNVVQVLALQLIVPIGSRQHLVHHAAQMEIAILVHRLEPQARVHSGARLLLLAAAD